MEAASDCFNLFFKNGILATRFYNQDGIHLTSSGVKRLLDDMNRQHQIVIDFNNCVFGPKRSSNFLGRLEECESPRTDSNKVTVTGSDVFRM